MARSLAQIGVNLQAFTRVVLHVPSSRRSPCVVPPGRYVLRAFESSAKDGSARQVDDKDIVVTG